MNKYTKILVIFQYINLSSKESFIINDLKMKLPKVLLYFDEIYSNITVRKLLMNRKQVFLHEI